MHSNSNRLRSFVPQCNVITLVTCCFARGLETLMHKPAINYECPAGSFKKMSFCSHNIFTGYKRGKAFRQMSP